MNGTDRHMQSTDRLRVVLDAGPAVHQSAGLARYTERLAFTLWREHRDTIDLSLVYNAHSSHQLPSSLSSIPSHSIKLGQYPWRLGMLACQLLQAPLLERRLPAGEVYHATEHLLPRLARPTVLTVHDLIFEHLPQYHTLTNRTFLRVAMPLFVGRADAIIAVSQHTKQDLVDLYRTAADKIYVIPQGINEDLRPADENDIRQVQERHAIRRPYLLMVGTLEPRKNHALAFAALRLLKAEGWPHCLVVVGQSGWLFESVRQQVEILDLTDDVIFTGRVPDADLPALYSGATCFLMPSLYEGFGFPVLEAMACGAPVVCSKASSLPEVTGDAAQFIEPLHAEGMAAAIRELLSKPNMAERMRQAGIRQAAQFRWQRAAIASMMVYHVVAGRNEHQSPQKKT